MKCHLCCDRADYKEGKKNYDSLLLYGARTQGGIDARLCVSYVAVVCVVFGNRGEGFGPRLNCPTSHVHYHTIHAGWLRVKR